MVAVLQILSETQIRSSRSVDARLLEGPTPQENSMIRIAILILFGVALFCFGAAHQARAGNCTGHLIVSPDKEHPPPQYTGDISGLPGEPASVSPELRLFLFPHADSDTLGAMVIFPIPFKYGGTASAESGSYNGNSFEFTVSYNEPYTFFGTICGNELSGTWSTPSGANGTWSATKEN